MDSHNWKYLSWNSTDDRACLPAGRLMAVVSNAVKALLHSRAGPTLLVDSIEYSADHKMASGSFRGQATAVPGLGAVQESRLPLELLISLLTAASVSRPRPSHWRAAVLSLGTCASTRRRTDPWRWPPAQARSPEARALRRGG